MLRSCLVTVGALVSAMTGCGGDADPVSTSLPTFTGVGESDPGPMTGGPTTDEPTSGAPTTDEPTTGEGGGGGKEVCDRYIQCVAVTTPNGLPDAQAGFGDDSACWTDPDDAALCVMACQAGLDQAHAAFPEEDACDACVSDGVCAEGESCLQGGCTAGHCGDGVVDADEVCDSNAGCDLDCQGPAECNPMSEHPCPVDETCRVVYSQDGDDLFVAECGGFGSPEDGGEGEACGEGEEIFEFTGCQSGLGCVLESVANMDCALDGCCRPFCDRGAPACPEGQQCVEYVPIESGQTVEPALAWLGVCVL